jgi:NNP family nitrate/nitrite transporter-like MFS transporter
MALFLACPMMVTFTIGALGVAAAIGLGNGAVFKLVPEYFPGSVGSVTGLVGAAGGLGGFFPPLVLGFVKEETGTFLPGFLMLSGFCLLCLLLLLRRPKSRQLAPAGA